MGETVGVKKDPLVNFEHFDTNVMVAADCGYMVSTEKPTKNVFDGGENCVG